MPSLRDIQLITRAAVNGRATEQDHEWLASPAIVVLWLKELRAFRNDLQDQVARKKRALSSIKPLPGTAASHEYLTAKQQVDAWHVGVLHLMRVVEEHIEEARTIMRLHGIEDLPRETLVEIVMKISENAKDSALSDAEFRSSTQQHMDALLAKYAKNIPG